MRRVLIWGRGRGRVATLVVLLAFALWVAAGAGYGGAAPAGTPPPRGVYVDPFLRWALPQLAAGAGSASLGSPQTAPQRAGIPTADELARRLLRAAPILAVYRDGQPAPVEWTRDPRVQGRPLSLPSSPGVVQLAPGETVRLGIFLQADSPSALRQAAARAGITLGTVVMTPKGAIATARVTPDQAQVLAAAPELRALYGALKAHPLLDESVPSTGAPAIWQQRQRGAGVLVGVVDTGIDYLHLDFRKPADANDRDEQASRILYLRDNELGLEYTQRDIEQAIRENLPLRHRDTDGHGTHVAGIAAGDGSSTPKPTYIGMAPNADLMVVKTTFNLDDVVDSVDYIFTRAAQLGRPAVTNLSLGTNCGPHDGTSPFELSVGELAGPGRIVVAAAGNSGNSRIHSRAELPRGGTHTVTFSISDSDQYYAVDAWYTGMARVTATIRVPGVGLFTVPFGYGLEPTLYPYLSASNTGPDPNNGDNRFVLVLDGSRQAIPTGDWSIEFSDATAPATLDAWLCMGPASFTGGDSRYTVEAPGTANGVITVAAYVTSKTTWPGGGRSTGETPGELATFSSRGPRRDKAPKPEIAAPGSLIVSALAAGSGIDKDPYRTPDGKYVALQGTSMAAPHVTGAVALLLEAAPSLSPTRVLDVLRQAATPPSGAARPWDPGWGYGKLHLTTEMVTARFPGEFGISVGPNPARGPLVMFRYTLDRNYREAHLRVLDITGRLVFQTVLPQANAGSHEYRWDLSTNSGQRLATGVYVFVMVADGRASRPGKLVLTW